MHTQVQFTDGQDWDLPDGARMVTGYDNGWLSITYREEGAEYRLQYPPHMIKCIRSVTEIDKEPF